MVNSMLILPLQKKNLTTNSNNLEGIKSPKNTKNIKDSYSWGDEEDITDSTYNKVMSPQQHMTCALQ